MGSASQGTSGEGPLDQGAADEREKKVLPETDPLLAKQISEQVTSLETEVLTIENSEVQARVRHLIKLIKTNLQSRTLDKKTQRELARLLSLTPTLDGRHAQQLNLLDLAVSILLEPHGSGTRSSRSEVNLDSQSAVAKNLVFVQETRRQITRQSRPYPDLLRTIFVTGGGTPYIRLISGLGWFFLLFVITPLTIAGITFTARDVAGFIEAQNKIAELQQVEKELSEETLRQQTQIETLIRRRDALAAQLGRTTSQIAAIASEETNTQPDTNNPVPEDSPSNAQNNVQNNTQGNIPSNAPTSPTAPSPEQPAQTNFSVPVSRQLLDNIQSEIEAELRSDLNRETSPSAVSQGANSDRETAAEETSPANRSLTDTPAATATNDWIFTTTFSLVLLAVAMGALGSTVSVIVRANTFIRQAQENENDLFLTGFFRPFVGMSFAIFCVALVEAGIFSGIFDLTNRKDTDRTYFYVAIAFVAGFSERLVRDVVVKTEDTIAGPTSKDDQWT